MTKTNPENSSLQDYEGIRHVVFVMKYLSWQCVSLASVQRQFPTRSIPMEGFKLSGYLLLILIH